MNKGPKIIINSLLTLLLLALLILPISAIGLLNPNSKNNGAEQQVLSDQSVRPEVPEGNRPPTIDEVVENTLKNPPQLPEELETTISENEVDDEESESSNESVVEVNEELAE